MPEEIKIYLTSRGLDPDDFAWENFYGFNWICIPVRDAEGDVMFFKLRRDPGDKKNLVKYKFYPQGSESSIFGLDKLKDYKNYVIICEGEFDCMLLRSKGINAITSTAGSGTFKDEWIDKISHIKKVFICFDNDEAGKKGARNLILKLIHTKHEVFSIDLPENMEGKDISDYFLLNSGSIQGLYGFVKPVGVSNIKLPEIVLGEDEKSVRYEISKLADVQDDYRKQKFSIPMYIYEYIMTDISRKMRKCQIQINKIKGYNNSVDIADIKAVPVLDILDSYGISYNRSSSNRVSFKLRQNENTASAFAYIAENSFCDYGSDKAGSVIDLVMSLDGCGVKEAINKLKTYVA